VSLAEGTQVFTPPEIIGLAEDLEAIHMGLEPDDRVLTCEQGGRVAGFAHYGPADIAEGTWYLYWIAVRHESHGQGLGQSLLQRVEQEARDMEGRLLLIETSSLPRYEATRKFYLRGGYRQECVIQNYYRDGDHKVIFSKRL
jgi:GNAT superfamily N-acetyltransferase